MGIRPKPLGMGLGILGCALFGWGLYHLMELGTCGDVGAASCPGGAWKYFVALPVGIMTAIVSIFLGSGAIGFVGIFVTVGVASILSGAIGKSDDDTFAYVFGGAFLFFALAPLALIPLAGRGARRQEQLMATGTKAAGTVLDVRDTGVTINENPRVQLRLRVEPQDGSAPFEVEKAVTVSRVAIPRAGDRYGVWFDPADRERFVVAEHAYRTEPIAPPPVAPVPPPPPAPEDPLDRIAKLNDLRLAGAITDEEFTAAKDRLLGSL